MSQDELKLAADLADAGEVDEAWDIVKKKWLERPNDPRVLLVATNIQDRCKNLGLAYQLAKRAVELLPENAAAWLNLGRTAEQLYLEEETFFSYDLALKYCKEDNRKALIYTNIGAAHITWGNWTEAEHYSCEALKLNPESRKAKGNLGSACLAQHKWVEGWRNYSAVINLADSRKRYQYKNEKEWDGRRKQTIVVTGEQGLGDEILFASILPNAMADSARVLLDCDKRLKGLFQRSFPNATVHGTRWEKALNWPIEDQEFDASCTLGELAKFYRRADADFPGTSYLKADPERVLMWANLFAAKKKPVVGVAWTGGVQWTGEKFRRCSLDDFLPLFRFVDAHYVCLQYKDASEEIARFKSKYPFVDLRQYSYGTLTPDYDDTAALVANLDLVVCVPTTVAHLAGALGIPCDVIANYEIGWHFAKEKMPWYQSVNVMRKFKNEAWENAINRYVESFCRLRLQSAA